MILRLRKFCAPGISYLEALLRLARHRLLRRQPPAVFLHSLFRSGSTYLFNAFRNETGFWCYYEPLHHQLIEIRQDRLAIFPFDKKTTDKMSHPHLSKPHFYEFKAVLKNDHIPFFNIHMSYSEFAAVRQHARLYKYVMTLLVSAPDKMIPLLQFNRSSLRIGWFKRFFRNALHVYILRNHRDQFESYFRQGEKYNIFLAINLYIIAANCKRWKFDQAYSSYKNKIQITSDLFYDLKRLAFLSAELDRAVHYRVFLHLWVTSLVEAKRHADIILDMNRLSESPVYNQQVVQLLRGKFALSPSIFSGCHIKRYDKYCMEDVAFTEIEREVCETYRDELDALRIGNLAEIQTGFE